MRQILQSLYTQLKNQQVSAKRFGKVAFTSLIAQAVSSMTNFFYTLYLIRSLTISDFGIYGIGFALALFLAGIGNAVFLTQMVVNYPDKLPEDRLKYSGRILIAILISCAVFIILGLFILFFGSEMNITMSKYRSFGFAVIGASVAFLIKDFFLRHAYNVNKETHALAINSSIAIAFTILLIAQNATGVILTSISALWIFAFANIFSAVLGFFIARLPFERIETHHLTADISEAWRGGRWLSITNLVTFIRIQAYVMIVGSIIGPEGVGLLNAPRTLVSPPLMLIPALGLVIMPRLSKIRVNSPNKVFFFGKIYLVGLLLLTTTYCFILLSTYKYTIPFFLGEKYNNLFVITFQWCLFICLLSISTVLDLMVQVFKDFKCSTKASFMAAVAALAATFLIVKFMGLSGALLGLAVEEIVLIVILWRGLFIISKKYKLAHQG